MRSLFASALLILSFLSASSQTQITLQQAITQGLAARADVGVQRLEQRIREERAAQDQGAYLPQINATFDTRYNIQRPTNVLPGEVVGRPGTPTPVLFGTKWNSTAGLSLTQKIYDPNASGKLKLARLDAEVQRSTTSIAEDEARLAIAEAWHQVVLAQAGLDLARSALQRANDAYAEDSARAAQGGLLAIDLERSLLDRGSALRKVDRTTRQLRIDRERLAQAIGWAEAEPPTVSSDIRALLADSLSTLPTAEAYAKRPELAERQAQLERDSFALRSEKRSWLPTVDLYGNANQQFFSNEFNPTDQGVWYPWSYAGLKLNLPILDGTSRTHRVREQQLLVEQRTLEHQDLQRSLALEARANIAEYELRRAELKDAMAEFDHSERVLAVDRSRATQGSITQASLARTREDLQDSTERLYQAIYGFLKAGLEVKRSTGTW
jgi:outer membrane protein TolC